MQPRRAQQRALGRRPFTFRRATLDCARKRKIVMLVVLIVILIVARLFVETMKQTLVTIFAVLLISAMPADAGDIARWQCGKTVVQVYVEYSPENSMGGDSPEPTYTLRFENPPEGHDRRRPGFTFKWRQDAEGPVFWGGYLNGKRCDRIQN